MTAAPSLIRQLIEFGQGRSRLVTTLELRVAGYSGATLHRFVRRGLLTPVARGVYVVGEPSLGHDELLTLGLTVAGRGSWLSGRTSAEERAILPRRFGHVDVTSPRPGRWRTIKAQVPMVDGAAGLIHLSHASTTAPTELLRGRPASSVPRLLVDLARSGEHFEAAWTEAAFLGLLDEQAIRAELLAGRRKGATRVRAKLGDRQALLLQATDLRTKLEAAFFAIVSELGLPIPETNVLLHLNGKRFRPDFLWRLIGLAIEVDGPHHLDPERVDADKVRDADLFVAEIDVLHFSDRAVYRDRARTAALVHGAYQRQLRRAGSAAGRAA